MAPSTLLFSSLGYQLVGSSSWSTMNVTLDTPDSPYGNSEPAVGQLKVWTNAH